MRLIWAVVASTLLSSCINQRYVIERNPAQEMDVKSLDRLDPKKNTVCSITLNSEEEIQTFKKRLSPRDFQFVELVSAEENWFQKAIQSGVRCDILLVSGHFAGTFFGDKGHLALTEFEEAACSEKAQGLFRNPKEVFLFGCNTLAGKDKDTRTPEQYRQVLLEDGYSYAEADQIAALRYSPVGGTFASRMSTVFSGVPRIYGFDSIGPSGKTVLPFLKKYFDSRPDYSKYLSGVDKGPNSEFLKALKDTAVTQVAGNSDNELRSSPSCFLANTSVADRSKMEWIGKVLKNPSSRFLYLSEIDNYLLKRRRSGPERIHDDKIIHALVADKHLKAEVSTLIKDGMKDFPTTRIQLLGVARYFGWLSQKETLKVRLELVGRYFEDGEISTEEKDELCSLVHGGAGGLLANLISYDLTKNLSWNFDAFQVMRCVKPEDPLIHRQIVDLIPNDSSYEALSVMQTLLTTDIESQKRLIEFMRKNEGGRTSLFIGTLANVRDPLLIDELFRIAMVSAGDESVREAAIETIVFSNPTDERVLKKLLIYTKEKYATSKSRFAIYRYLADFKSLSPDILSLQMSLLKEDQGYGVRGNLHALRINMPRTEENYQLIKAFASTTDDSTAKEIADEILKSFKRPSD